MKRLARRRFLEVLATVALVPACSKAPFACSDTAGLTSEETTARNALGYVDTSPNAAKACLLCRQYTKAPSGPGACGGCKVLKGPIHPAGTCKTFTPDT